MVFLLKLTGCGIESPIKKESVDAKNSANQKRTVSEMVNAIVLR